MKKQKNLVRIISVTLTLTLLVQVGAVGFAANALEEKPEATERVIETYSDSEALISEEITGRREENVKHFRLENGQNIAIMYSAPVNYLDSEGVWQEIDNSLVLNDKNTETPFYSLKASNVDLRLPEAIGGTDKIYIAKDGNPFEMGLVSERNNKSEKAIISNNIETEISYDENASAIEKSNSARIQSAETASKVEYKAAFDGADLEYTISSSGIKEEIVIGEPQNSYTYGFELNYGSLVPVTMADGSIGFFASEEDEEPVYILSAPYMYDAEGEISEEVEMTLSGNILTVSADESWINKSSRAFPVVIDPTVTIYSSSFSDSHVRRLQKNQNYGSNSSLFAGKTSTSMRRTYIKFTLPSLPDNAVVVNADLNITQDSSPADFGSNCRYLYLFDLTGYSSWSESGITWNNQPLSGDVNAPQTNGTPVAAVMTGNNSSNHKYTFDVSENIKRWYKNGGNNGFMISTNNENNNGQAKFYSSEASSNKPNVVITYTENVGLKEYWPYQSVDMGDFGAAYINTQNGTLYYTHNDASTSGLVLPVGVSHFYAGPQDFLSGNVENMKFGKGFTINLIEKIVGSRQAYVDSYGNTHTIIHGGEDYNYRYFIEDDPSTDVQSISGGYKIVYLDGSSKTFNSSGYLVSVTDKNQNSIQITYTSGKITQVTSGANQAITFSYNSSDYLTAVTDNAGRATQFAYNANGYLTQITHPDLTSTQLSYSSGYLYEVKNAVNAKVRFTPETVTYASNSFCRVKSVTNYGENNSSSYSDKVDFTYNGNSTVIENNHGDALTVQFDELGRAVSHSSKGNTSKMMYNSDNTVHAKSNSFASKCNLLYKDEQKVSYWDKTGYGITKTTSTDRAYYYSQSLKVVGNNANGSFSPRYTQVRVSAGKTYTSMVNVNIDGIASQGKLYLRAESGSETVESPAISTTGDGWLPLYVTLTVPSGATSMKLSLVFEGFTGTAYSDMAYVTEGGSASVFNMIPESDFSDASRYGSTSWSGNREVDTNNKQLIVYSNFFSDSAGYQTFPLKGAAGEEFVFGFSAQSVAFPLQNTCFYGAKVIFLSGNTEVTVVSLPLNPENRERQYVVTTVSSTADFDSVRVEFRNDMMLRDAYFKDVFLYKGTAFGYNYEYNGNKFVTNIGDGAGNSKHISYTGADITGVQQTSNGVTMSNVTYTYDSNHNILTAADQTSGITTSYTYPASGNKGLPLTSTVTSEDNLTATTSYGYSSDYNYLTSITDPSGGVTQYAYNTAKGLVTKVTDPNGNETNYSYNSNDLLGSIYADVGNDVAQVNYHYDILKRLTSISNTDISYAFTYDLFGRSDTSSSSGNMLTDMTYNGDSTVSRIDTAGGNYTTYTYDDRDRVTSESYNGNLAYTYKYNDSNALTEVYDAESDVATSYLYDSLGRTVGVSSSDGKNSAYVYDAQSRPVRNVIAENNEIISDQTYSYDSRSRVTGTEIDSIGSSVSYSYDGLNRLTSDTASIGTDKTVSRSYTYKTNGTNQTGLVDIISYSKTISGNTTQLYPNLRYEYDANGNITKGKEGFGEYIRYYYDELNRLIREDNYYYYETVVYNYDENGDILSKDIYYYTTDSTLPASPVDSITYSYTSNTWKNAVTMYDGESITYDAEGNPTSYRGHTMTWSRNRLTSAYYNNQTVSYTYDANGLRTGKNTGYDEYTYYYSGTKLIKINYGYNNDAYFYYGADGRPYAINYSGILYYYILNLQGDVVGLCDENGNVVVYYAYDAWGKVTIRSASNTYLANFNPLRYRGYFYDQETGLYYLHNRYYDPETGRFISADAYLVAGNHINSTNMFAYCLNNPVMYVDPSGRASIFSYLRTIIAFLQIPVGDDTLWNVLLANSQAEERIGMSLEGRKYESSYVQTLDSGLKRATIIYSVEGTLFTKYYVNEVYYGDSVAWQKEENSHKKTMKVAKWIQSITSTLLGIYYTPLGIIAEVTFLVEEDEYGEMLSDASLASLKYTEGEYAVMFGITEISGSDSRYIYKYGSGWIW